MPDLSIRSKILIIFLSFTFLSPVRAGAQEPLAESLRKDVTFLADSTMRGREIGSPMVQRAVFYIANTFKRSGLWTGIQSFRVSGKVGHNIIGVTPGYYDRYILVCSYFDGLGEVSGKVYPGADSNASGVAALLSLSRKLARSASDSTTGIIFAAFDGHGADMAGSKAFYDSFSTQYNVTLVVNLDILGSTLAPVRKNRPDYLIALGGMMYDFSLSRANRGPGLHLTYDYYGSRNFTDLFYKSMGDQKWFVQKKVPAVMFTSGITLNTNKATDTVETLDFDVMARRVTLIGDWLGYQL